MLGLDGSIRLTGLSHTEPALRLAAMASGSDAVSFAQLAVPASERAGQPIAYDTRCPITHAQW
jgi:hypothetical protein